MLWTALGESVAGSSHRARNVNCQDAFRFQTFGDSGEWLVVAAADGAGSASHSEFGATAVCDEFVRLIGELNPTQLLTRDSIVRVFTEVRVLLFAVAERHGVQPRDVACTSLLTVVGPTSAVFAQVGDGAIVIGREHEYRPIFWPEPAEYANATDFLTDDDFPSALRFEVIKDSVVEVAVLTDGLQRLALDYATRRGYAGFFCPLFDKLKTVMDLELLSEPFRRFLDSDRVNERTDDDKTLVLAVRRL